MSTPRKVELPMAARTYNSSTQEGEAGVQELKVHFLYMRLGLSWATGEPVPKGRKGQCARSRFQSLREFKSQ